MEGQVAQPGGPGGPDPVLGSGPQPVTEFEGGDRPARGIGREACDPHAVRVRDPQLGPRVGPFLSDDQPHVIWPAVQELVGELGDPGPVTGLTVGLDGRVQAEAGWRSVGRPPACRSSSGAWPSGSASWVPVSRPAGPVTTTVMPSRPKCLRRARLAGSPSGGPCTMISSESKSVCRAGQPPLSLSVLLNRAGRVRVRVSPGLGVWP